MANKKKSTEDVRKPQGGFSVSISEFEKLKQNAIKERMSISQFIRERCIYQYQEENKK